MELNQRVSLQALGGLLIILMAAATAAAGEFSGIGSPTLPAVFDPVNGDP